MSSSKVVIITGGGRGIGAATARLFAQQGYAVCINYKENSDAAEQLVTEINAADGECIAVKADVSVEADVKALFAQVEATWGRLDVLVNNAAILKPQSRLVDMSAERINQIMTTNITSCFLTSKEAIKRMSTALGGKGGAIVNVSSAAARSGSPNEYVDYAASKGAIDTLTKGLSIELAHEGIRVNCVRPGFIKTDMHRDGGEPDRVARLANAIPLQRGGEPEEVAQAIYWLASEQSSYSTGNFLDLAGGL